MPVGPNGGRYIPRNGRAAPLRLQARAAYKNGQPGCTIKPGIEFYRITIRHSGHAGGYGQTVAVNADRAAVARAACCAGPCRSPCAADRGQFRTAAAACKAAAPATAVRVRPPPPPSRQRRAPERHRARSPRARFRFRGLFAPAGTPAPIVAKLNKDATEIISTADVRNALLTRGAEAFTTTPQEMAEFLRAEIVKWKQVVQDAGIGMNQ